VSVGTALHDVAATDYKMCARSMGKGMGDVTNEYDRRMREGFFEKPLQR
jgi:hypothetical protein